ncbi:MAG: LysE family translocator [Paracoccaceae bacterium]
MSLDFLITSMVVILIPGTGVICTLATGLGAGRGASVAAAFGWTLGILPHIAAAMFGLAAVLHASAVLFTTVKYLGTAYLLYLAWLTLREAGPVTIERRGRPGAGKSRIVSTGFLINILNPKLSVFFLAFLPQFVDAGSPSWIADMLTLAAAFMALTFAVFVVYGFFAALIGEVAMQSEVFMRWFRRVAATAFASFGVRLALSDAQ